MLTNIFINVGFLLSFSCGMLLPEDKETFNNDESWKLVTAMPAFIGFLSVMLAVIFFPEEPVGWYVANDRMEDANRSIRSVYTVRKTSLGKAASELALKRSSDGLFNARIVLQRSTTSMD